MTSSLMICLFHGQVTHGSFDPERLPDFQIKISFPEAAHVFPEIFMSWNPTGTIGTQI
jgi:hypothetical protein